MTRLLTPAPSTPLCTSEMNQDLVALVVGPRGPLEIAETDISTSARNVLLVWRPEEQGIKHGREREHGEERGVQVTGIMVPLDAFELSTDTFQVRWGKDLWNRQEIH